jgi:hypothetical protein
MLYAIGDLHLSVSAGKPMDVFGGAWDGYTDKIEAGLSALTAEDTLILAGDTSWGMSLKESLPDFEFLQRFPCKKILLKGNHDYFWETASKMKKFFAANGLHGFDILHNNAYLIEGMSVCGTRGWFDDTGGHDEKMMNREVIRLRASLDEGLRLGGELCVFLHYPPVYEGHRCDPILDVLEEYEVSRCFFGHLHGHACGRAIEGEYRGTHFRLISADHIGFAPVLIAG